MVGARLGGSGVYMAVCSQDILRILDLDEFDFKIHWLIRGLNILNIPSDTCPSYLGPMDNIVDVVGDEGISQYTKLAKL